MSARPGSKVGYVTSVTRDTSCREESVCVSSDDTHTHTHIHVSHVVRTDVCEFLPPACDDDCTGVLLDDLETIHNHFLSVNLSGVAMAPYRQLVLLENQTRDIQVNNV